MTTPPPGFDPNQGQQPQYGQQPYGQQPQTPPPGFNQPGYGAQPQQPYDPNQQQYGQASPPYGTPQQQPYGAQQPYGGQQQYGQPYGGQPMGAGGGLDYIQLPGVGAVRLASMGQRFLARVVDAIIVGIPFFILYFVLGAAFASSAASSIQVDPETGQVVSGGAFLGGGFIIFLIAPLIFLVLQILYEVSMIATRGATLGKQVAGVKVIRELDGQLPGWGGAFTRWAVMVAPVIVPCLGSLWVLLCELSPFFDNQGRRQGWHDKAAKTIVTATK